jgi:anti-sigma regulatory factor (Ser/Thr protein kinase)
LNAGTAFPVKFNYRVSAADFTGAGVASGDVRKKLKKLGVSPGIIRRVAIAMYEAEINMVIHARGGEIDVELTDKDITIVLADHGPGIADIDWAEQEGSSTADEDIRSLGFGAGMGIPNMKKSADYLDIQSELGVGTTVTIRINMEVASVAP